MGDSKPDWWIVSEIAKRMGAPGFDCEDPSEIMGEIARLTPSVRQITKNSKSAANAHHHARSRLG